MPDRTLRKFRQGITAVVIDDQGRVLLGERSDHLGSWQFPQGGIERGESPEQACLRELEEELGAARCEILKRGSRTTNYVWPEGSRRGKYAGQEMTWFLCRLKLGVQPDLENSDHCFRAVRWDSIDNAVKLIVDWKRPTYVEGLSMLGLLPAQP